MQQYAFAPQVYLNCIYMPKYAKSMHQYAKYEGMKIICIMCTSHFADACPGGAELPLSHSEVHARAISHSGTRSVTLTQTVYNLGYITRHAEYIPGCDVFCNMSTY